MGEARGYHTWRGEFAACLGWGESAIPSQEPGAAERTKHRSCHALTPPAGQDRRLRPVNAATSDWFEAHPGLVPSVGAVIADAILKVAGLPQEAAERAAVGRYYFAVLLSVLKARYFSLML